MNGGKPRTDGMRIAAIGLFLAAWMGIAALAQTGPATRAAAEPATMPGTVMLGELSNLYEPVPFDHAAHADMTKMRDGCATCHHKTSGSAYKSGVPFNPPPCKDCHAPLRTELNQPGLRGAYHQQCLGCHKDWSHANHCTTCHQPREGAATQPTSDQILGKMHPPIEEPGTIDYVARFTPADGRHVHFRHKEHIDRFGVACVNCHTKETSCARCHDQAKEPEPVTAAQKERSWKLKHEKCFACHQDQRCDHCHYKDGEKAPAIFAHASTGQTLDADHAKATCAQCHVDHAFKAPPTCGDDKAGCHADGKMKFPAHRPGPTLTTRPSKPLLKK